MKTLLIGASNNPSRYAFFAAQRLKSKGHEIVLLSKKKGEVEGTPLIQTTEGIKHIDTVTLYLGADKQSEYHDFLLQLKPRRVIFNPGAENPTLMNKLIEKGVDAFEACTLVMLASNQY